MTYLGVGVSPGKVAVRHSTNVKLLDRRIKVAELFLRCLDCGLGVLAAVLVATDTQVKEIFTIQKKAKFTDMKALVFLVTANGIATAYSLIQGLRCVVSMINGHVLFRKPLILIIFSSDQINRLQNNSLSNPNQKEDQQPSLSEYWHIWQCLPWEYRHSVCQGQPKLQWMKICDMHGKFCNQVGEGIATAVLASLSMVVLSCISAFALFRLYGGNKNKNLVIL